MARVRLELGPVPLHHQVYLDLRRALDAGEWRPGQQLPTERDLADQYGCSLITVRRALDELVREGRIERTRGRGTFVLHPRLDRDIAARASFTDRDAGSAAWTPRRGSSPPGPSRPSAVVAGALGLETGLADPLSRAARAWPAASPTCSSRSTCRPSGSRACWPATSSTAPCTSAWPPRTGRASCAPARLSSPSSSGLERLASSDQRRGAAGPAHRGHRLRRRRQPRSSSAGPTSAAIAPATTSNARSTGPIRSASVAIPADRGREEDG